MIELQWKQRIYLLIHYCAVMNFKCLCTAHFSLISQYWLIKTFSSLRRNTCVSRIGYNDTEVAWQFNERLIDETGEKWCILVLFTTSRKFTTIQYAGGDAMLVTNRYLSFNPHSLGQYNDSCFHWDNIIGLVSPTCGNTSPSLSPLLWSDRRDSPRPRIVSLCQKSSICSTALSVGISCISIGYFFWIYFFFSIKSMAHVLEPNIVKYACFCGHLNPITKLYFCRHCLKLRCGFCVCHEVSNSSEPELELYDYWTRN